MPPGGAKEAAKALVRRPGSVAGVPAFVDRFPNGEVPEVDDDRLAALRGLLEAEVRLPGREPRADPM
jgi:hypothetical protein